MIEKVKNIIIVLLLIIIGVLISIKFINGILSNEEKFMKDLNKQKIDDYLYSVTFKDYDYNEGQEYLNNVYDIPRGGCSTVRNGEFFGRNYDWYYEDASEFVISVPKKKGRHASIGMAYSRITNEEANTNEYSDKYKVIPFLTNDGINDSGVVISINVVPTGDMGYTTGTNPNGDDLMTLLIPRFVLDNAGSVDEAIELLKNRNIYTPLTEKMAQEFHFMIADKNKTVVIEFVNNKMVVIENENIMTNFYLTNFDINNLPNHAMGIERYNILKDGYSKGNTKDGMVSLMKEVFYTKAYDLNTSPYWYSEFSGIYKGIDLTTKNVGESNLNGDVTKSGAYETYLTRIQELYKDRTRNKVFWLTNHSSVYDLNKLSLNLIVQENNIEHTFRLKK